VDGLGEGAQVGLLLVGLVVGRAEGRLEGSIVGAEGLGVGDAVGIAGAAT
jgi:hypothetical protein